MSNGHTWNMKIWFSAEAPGLHLAEAGGGQVYGEAALLTLWLFGLSVNYQEHLDNLLDLAYFCGLAYILINWLDLAIWPCISTHPCYLYEALQFIQPWSYPSSVLDFTCEGKAVVRGLAHLHLLGDSCHGAGCLNVQADHDICVPKKLTYGMLLEPRCTGRNHSFVWKNVCGSFLTKT